MFPNAERLYMVRSIKYVHHARHSTGTGDTDFEPDLDDIQPDIFYVNEDGDRPAKREIVQKRGIQYVVAKREPEKGLAVRSSTAIKKDLNTKRENEQKEASMEHSKDEQHPVSIEQFKSNIIWQLKDIRRDVIQLESNRKAEREAAGSLNGDALKFPWRLCLSGGWLDQPWVSKVVRGGVVVMNVDHHSKFKNRSGLATSTRNTALRLWANGRTPDLSNEEIAKLVFGAENPPGTKDVAGSQDHLGLFLPGINRLDYKGEYWPYRMVSMKDAAKERGKSIESIYKFVEKVLWLIPMHERNGGYDPLITKHLTESNVEKLADASEAVWRGILNCDAKGFGKGLTETVRAWKAILPNTVPSHLDPIWQKYDSETHGCLFSGCGGGFLMVVADARPSEHAFQIKINAKDWWQGS